MTSPVNPLYEQNNPSTIKVVFENVWPIDYKDEENRELDLRQTLKKLIFYLIFLGCITAVIIGMIDPLTYTFTNKVRGQFLDVDFTSSGRKGPIRFADIQDHADFWMYLHEVAIPNLFYTKWYSPFIPVTNDTEDDDKKFLFENSLLGCPRWREVKVKPSKCKTYKQFKKYFKECYNAYASENILKINLDESFVRKKKGAAAGIVNDTDYEEEYQILYNLNDTESEAVNLNATGPALGNNGTNGTSSNVTEPLFDITYYEYNKPSSPYLYYGVVGTYDSGGYIQYLYKNLNQSMEVIKFLYNLWSVNRTTRAIFIDFTYYNANVNLFCICKLVFEVPPTGGFITSSSFDTVKLIRYKNKSDFVLLGLEVIVMLYIIYFVIQEGRNLFYYRLRYFRFYWTYINLFIVIGLILLIPFNSYKFFLIPKTIKRIDKKPDEFADLEYIVYWQKKVKYLEALLLFFIWIKIFRYFNVGKSTGIIGGTIKNASMDLIIFLTLFFIVFFGYAQMGYLLFGEHMDQFSTFGKSLMTLLMTLLGDFDYYAIERTNKIFAPIFFVTFIFFVFFILFNMFIAIITDTFLYLKNEYKANKSDLTLKVFFGRFLRNLATKCCPKNYPPIDKSWPLSGEIMLQKLTKVLKLCNFNDLEIKLFFQKYNIHQTGVVDNELVYRMLKKIKSFKTQPGETFLKSEEKFSTHTLQSQQAHLEFLRDNIQTAAATLNTLAAKYREQLKKVNELSSNNNNN